MCQRECKCKNIKDADFDFCKANDFYCFYAVLSNLDIAHKGRIYPVNIRKSTHQYINILSNVKSLSICFGYLSQMLPLTL